MQKQNPFLKPTPLFSNSYASSSYSAYPVSKYSSYSSFEVSKPMVNYDSYSNNIERLPEAVQPSKFKSSTDINDILKNNPFNRPPPSIFSGSSANSYSPVKYESTKTYQQYPPTSYERPISSKPRTNYSINDKPAYPQQQSRHTPKKYDNYLSTSSADSATTYINRIYDIQQQKSQGTSNLSNPFLRKNLIEDRVYDKQVKSTNSYDNAALKYIASHKQKPYMENNYLASSNQPRKINKYEANNYKAYQEYEQPHLNPYKTNKNDYNNYDNDYKAKTGKYDKYDANIDKYDSKYNNYEVSNDKYQRPLNNYEKYQSKQDYKDKPLSKKDIYQPSKYQQYTSPQYDSAHSKFNFDQEDPYTKPKISEAKDQYDFSDKYNSKRYEEQLRREKQQETLRRERFDDPLQPSNKYESYGYDHKYSFKPEYTPKEESKKSIQRVPQFGESKNKVKEYSAADYETLGGRQEPYRPKEQTYTPAGGSKKLISSQVQQYSTNPYQKQQNLNPYKAQATYKAYEQAHQVRQKFMAYDEEEQQPRTKSKGAVRDHQQGFPKMLEYNGMVFYRIQVK